MAGQHYVRCEACQRSTHREELIPVPAQTVIEGSLREFVRVCLRCVERINDGEDISRLKKVRGR
jgi:hypothetical protein